MVALLAPVADFLANTMMSTSAESGFFSKVVFLKSVVELITSQEGTPGEAIVGIGSGGWEVPERNGGICINVKNQLPISRRVRCPTGP